MDVEEFEVVGGIVIVLRCFGVVGKGSSVGRESRKDARGVGELLVEMR